MIQNATNSNKHRWMQRWKTKRVLKTNFNEKHQMQLFSETFRKHKILVSSSKAAHEICKMWQTPEKNSRCKGQGPLETLRKHANGRVTIPNEARTMQDIANNIEIQ
jgi:hypothetical protein